MLSAVVPRGDVVAPALGKRGKEPGVMGLRDLTDWYGSARAN